MNKKKYVIINCILLACVLILMYMNLSLGRTNYSLADIINIILGNTTRGRFTIMNLRLPKIVLGMLAAILFALGGNIFQKLLNNPLASPDIIGISTSASFGAVLAALIFKFSGVGVFFVSLLLSLCTAGVIYLISKGNLSTLILTGIGIQAFYSAMIQWLLTIVHSNDVSTAMRYMSGSLNNAEMSEAGVLLVVLILGSILITILNYDLELLKLGKELPHILGVDVSKVKMCFMCVGVIFAAMASAITGPIGSLSFLSGPIASRIMNNGKNNMIMSALVGCVIVLFALFLSENVLPYRYPIGIITGLLGAPYLIMSLVTLSKKGRV